MADENIESLKERQKTFTTSNDGSAASLKQRQQAFVKEDTAMDNIIQTAKDFSLGGFKGLLNVPDIVASGPSTVMENMINAPLDIMNLVLSDDIPRVNLPKPTSSGSMGIETPRNAAGFIGEEVGAMIVPSTAMIKRAKQIQHIDKLPRLIRGVMAAAKNRTKTFVATETIAATGAGIGRTIADTIFPGNVGAEVAGQVIGSFVTIPIDIALFSGRLTRRLLGGMTKDQRTKKALDLASYEIRATATNPNKAATQLGKPLPIDIDLPSGSRSRDPGLASLERDVIRRNAQLTGRWRDAEAHINQTIKSEIAGALDGKQSSTVATEFVKGEVTRLNQLMDERISLAIRSAKKSLEKVGGKLKGTEASKATRIELESAYSAVRQQEKNLWRGLDPNIKINTDSLQRELINILKETGKINISGKVPVNLIKKIRNISRQVTNPPIDVFGRKLDDTETIIKNLATSADMQDIRSETLALLRKEITKINGKNPTLIRNLGRIQEATLQSVEDSITTAGGNTAELTAALNFSKSLNDTFTRGPLAPLIGFSNNAVPDIATLDKLFVTGPRGLSNMEMLFSDLVKKNTKSDSLRLAVEDFVIDRFVDQATENGKVVPARAARFLKNYKEAFEKFPDLEKRLRNAESAEMIAQVITRGLEGNKKTLASKSKSIAALFLNKDPELSIANVLNSGKPGEAMGDLIKILERDPSGKAVEGLKRIFYNNMISEIELSGLDANLAKLTSTAKFQNYMKNNARAMRKLYSAPEIKRMEQVLKTKELAETQTNAIVRGGSTTPQDIKSTNALRQVMLRITGAKIGNKLNKIPGFGGDIQTPGFTSRAIAGLFQNANQQAAEALIEEAIFDPALMQVLLMNITKETAPLIERRLRGHMINLAILDPNEGTNDLPEESNE